MNYLEHIEPPIWEEETIMWRIDNKSEWILGLTGHAKQHNTLLKDPLIIIPPRPITNRVNHKQYTGK